MLTNFRVISCSVLLMCLTASLRAEEPTPAPSPKSNRNKPAAISVDEVQALLQQLESGKYKERIAAMKQLMDAGIVVIPLVTKSAYTDDLELGARCVDILKHLYKNGDAPTKAAAEKSLKELQKSKHISVAQWADDALRPKDDGNPFGGNNPFGNVGGIRIQIAGNRIAGQRPVLQRTANATDGDKKIEIKETIGGVGPRIVMKITEKVNGKEKTTEYKATSTADLRRQSQPAYDLYRKHIKTAKLQIVGGNGVAVLQRGAGNVQGGGNIQIRSQTVNGNREMNIVENGRKITITDQNKQNIHIKVTETVNGKEKTTEYRGKDLDELKKKHPDGAKIYERLAAQPANLGGRIRLRRPVQANPLPPGFNP